MAHECPECGMVCYCGGDIDDCEFNGPGSGQERCAHKCDVGGADDDDWQFGDRDEPESLVMACSYPGCCMPGEHFPSECHNAEDMIRWFEEHEKEKPTCQRTR
jgi:hypothetical protein